MIKYLIYLLHIEKERQEETVILKNLEDLWTNLRAKLP